MAADRSAPGQIDDLHAYQRVPPGQRTDPQVGSELCERQGNLGVEFDDLHAIFWFARAPAPSHYPPTGRAPSAALIEGRPTQNRLGRLRSPC